MSCSDQFLTVFTVFQELLPNPESQPSPGTAPGTPRLRHSWWKVLFAPIPIPSALVPSLLGHKKTIPKRMFICNNTVQITSCVRTVLVWPLFQIWQQNSGIHFFSFLNFKLNSPSGESLNKQLGVRLNLYPLGGKKNHHKTPQHLHRSLLTQQLSETWWVVFF